MSGAHAAVAAAQAKKKKQKEEEEMTNYTERELSEDYEFKIVRSATGAFKKREKVEQAIAEEATADRNHGSIEEVMARARAKGHAEERAHVQQIVVPVSVEIGQVQIGGPAPLRDVEVLPVESGEALVLGVELTSGETCSEDHTEEDSRELTVASHGADLHLR